MGLLSNPVFAKLEAWGYLWLLSLRGAGFTTNIFMNIALLKFGYGSVGCTPTGSDIGYNATMERVQTIEEADLAGDECQGTLPLVGLPILSGYILLNTISTTMALLVTPIFGTIVDHSPSRKFHTFATCSVYVLVNAIAIAASPSNWFVMICLALFLQQGAYQFHVACVAAYCTEIADGDEQIIALQNAGRVFELSFMLFFAALIGVVGKALGDVVERTAVLGQVIATVYCVPIMFVAYARIEERPALQAGEADLCYGFRRLRSTVKELWATNFYVLQYLVGLAFVNAANMSVIGLTPLYAMQQLNIENPTGVVGITIVACIPGALINNTLSKRLGMRRQLGNLISTAAATIGFLVAFVHREGQVLEIYACGFVCGLVLGGIYPSLKGVYMSIIPAGQEVEFQGLYTFFAMVMGFLPTTWFGFAVDSSLGGEAGARRVGLVGIIVFYAVGFFLCSYCLDDKKAKEVAAKTAHLRARGKLMIGSASVVHAVDEGEGGVKSR